MKTIIRLAAGAFLAWCLMALPLKSGGEQEWPKAVRDRTWVFPRDHGAHPEFKTEWWYFTGQLADSEGRKFGYQLTFFREGLRRTADSPQNPWSVRDLAMAHWTMTNAAADEFRCGDLLSRTGPGLASWRTETLDVHVLGWSARLENGAIVLHAAKGGMALDLVLSPRKPPVLHGQNGLSRKGPAEGEASYYASWTDLETRGTIIPRPGLAPSPVQGRSWFDHEFGSGLLAENQTGWDWISLHFSDGRDLMIYLLRRTDGSIESASSGTLIEADGRSRHLGLSEIEVEVRDHWKSPHSGGRYPSRWRIRLPEEGLELFIRPLIADQEVRPTAMPALIYWEGAVFGEGRARGKAVNAEGYIELTGYAGNLRTVF